MKIQCLFYFSGPSASRWGHVALEQMHTIMGTGQLDTEWKSSPDGSREPFQEQSSQHCPSSRKEKGGERRGEGFVISTELRVRISEVGLKMGSCRA